MGILPSTCWARGFPGIFFVFWMRVWATKKSCFIRQNACLCLWWPFQPTRNRTWWPDDLHHSGLEVPHGKIEIGKGVGRVFLTCFNAVFFPRICVLDSMKELWWCFIVSLSSPLFPVVCPLVQEYVISILTLFKFHTKGQRSGYKLTMTQTLRLPHWLQYLTWQGSPLWIVIFPVILAGHGYSSISPNSSSTGVDHKHCAQMHPPTLASINASFHTTLFWITYSLHMYINHICVHM